MTTNQLMTAGAIGFAVFALYFVTKQQGGGAISTQPGQQARDAGLQAWTDQQAAQWADMERQQLQQKFRETENLYRATQDNP